MSNVTPIGKTYAKAFLAAQITDQDVRAFLDISRLLTSNPLFARMLSVCKHHNGCKNSESKWIEDIAVQASASQKIVNFFKLIVLKGRLDCLDNIVSAVEELSNQKAGRGEVTLILFQTASEAELTQITQEIKQMTKIDPILNIVIDPEILGGYIIRTKSIIVDNSLRKRLEKLHNVMKGVA